VIQPGRGVVALAGETHVEHDGGAVAVGVFVRCVVVEGRARQVPVSDWTMLRTYLKIV
jgi:hypothetical protein